MTQSAILDPARCHARPDALRSISEFVRLAKGLAVALVVIAGLSTAPSHAVEDPLIAFIRTVGAQALAVIHRPDVPIAGKISYFRELVRQDFDMAGISRSV